MEQYDQRYTCLYNQFDFMILAYGRMGTLSLWQYLNHHEDIIIPDFDKTDQFIFNEKNAISKNKPLVKKVGLIVHGHSYNDLIFKNSLNICQRVKPLIAYQCVRNPFLHMLSSFNTQIKMDILTCYIKDKIYLPLDDKIVERNHFENSHNYIEKNINHVLYNKLNNCYNNYFKKMKMIDFSEFSKDSLKTVNTIYKDLELDLAKNNDDKFKKISKHSDLTMLMRFAGYGFEFDDDIIRGSFFFDDSWLVPRCYNVKIGVIEANTLPGFMCNKKVDTTPDLSFRFHREGWNKLSQKTRDSILDGEFFDKIILDEFYPRWLERISIILNEFSMHKRDEFEYKESNLIERLIKKDKFKFLMKYPELEDSFL
jgi:hypothetical protein